MNKSCALIAATLTLAAQGLQITSLSQEAPGVVYSYQGYDVVLNQSDAQKHCEKQGLRLAEVRNAAEQKAVKQEVLSYQGQKKHFTSGNFESTWLGLTKKDDKWSWASGHKFGYSNWWTTVYQQRPNDQCAFTGNHNGWIPFDCTENKSIRVVCEKRASAVADTCTAAAVGFETSIASPEGWKAYQDRIGCKEKASGARKATRDAAVEAYLKASEGTKAVEADVAKTLAAQKKAASDKVTATTALAAAKKVVTEGNAAVTKAEGVLNAATTAVTTADNAHKVATGKKTTHDANLATLKAAAIKAHAAFGTGVKALSDEIQK